VLRLQLIADADAKKAQERVADSTRAAKGYWQSFNYSNTYYTASSTSHRMTQAGAAEGRRDGDVVSLCRCRWPLGLSGCSVEHHKCKWNTKWNTCTRS
jgi:hypothetical protein